MKLKTPTADNVHPFRAVAVFVVLSCVLVSGCADDLDRLRQDEREQRLQKSERIWCPADFATRSPDFVVVTSVA